MPESGPTLAEPGFVATEQTTAPPRLLVAVAAPLAVIALAGLLWAISDRLVSVGPLDRATFGGLVVVPTFGAAPVVAAVVWSRLASSSRTVAAFIVWVAVAGVVGVLFFLAATPTDCANGPRQEPSFFLLPSLILGGVLGAGPSWGGLAGARLLIEKHRVRAVATAIAIQVAAIGAAILVFAWLALSSGGCNRPPAG